MALIQGKSCIINIPDNVEGSIPVFVLFPGIGVTCDPSETAIGVNPPGGHHKGRAYMPPAVRKAVPDWFSKYVLVFPNEHTTSFATVEAEYSKELTKHKITVSGLNVSVFSGSGSNSSIPFKRSLKSFIIMDATPANYIISGAISSFKSGTSVFFMFRQANWNDNREGKMYVAPDGIKIPIYFPKSFEACAKELIKAGIPEKNIANIDKEASKYGFIKSGGLCGQSLFHMIMPERSLSYWKSEIEALQTSSPAPVTPTGTTGSTGSSASVAVEVISTTPSVPVEVIPPRPKLNRDLKFNVEVTDTFKIVGTINRASIGKTPSVPYDIVTENNSTDQQVSTGSVLIPITATLSVSIGDLVINATQSAEIKSPSTQVEEWDFVGDEELDEEYGEEPGEMPSFEADEIGSWSPQRAKQDQEDLKKVLEEDKKKEDIKTPTKEVKEDKKNETKLDDSNSEDFKQTIVKRGKYTLDMLPGEWPVNWTDPPGYAYKEEDVPKGAPYGKSFDRNGKVAYVYQRGSPGPAIKLCNINGKPVNVAIVESYYYLKEAVAAAGLPELTVISGFRLLYKSPDGLFAKSQKGVSVEIKSQQYFWECYIQKNCNKGNTAGEIGLSQHCNGLALDLPSGGSACCRHSSVNYKYYSWLVKNAWKFGWIRTVYNEEWHFEYKPTQAKNGPYGALAGTDANRFYSVDNQGNPLGLDKLKKENDWGSTVKLEK